MAFLPSLSKRSSLLFAILTTLIVVNPSIAFGVPEAVRKSRKSQAISSPLFGSRSIKMPKQRKLSSRLIPFASSSAIEETPQEEDQITWKDRLLKMSNIASILCVIDCTVLPIVTVLLPLLGLAAFTPAQMEWLHNFGMKEKE